MPLSLGSSLLDMRKVVKTSLSGVCNYVLFFNKHLSFILFPVLYYIALNLNIFLPRRLKRGCLQCTKKYKSKSHLMNCCPPCGRRARYVIIFEVYILIEYIDVCVILVIFAVWVSTFAGRVS